MALLPSSELPQGKCGAGNECLALSQCLEAQSWQSVRPAVVRGTVEGAEDIGLAAVGNCASGSAGRRTCHPGLQNKLRPKQRSPHLGHSCDEMQGDVESPPRPSHRA